MTITVTLELATEISFERSGVPFTANLDNFNDTILAELLYHGIIQKIGDAGAGKSGQAAKDAIQAVYERLCNGEWTGRRSSATDPLAKLRKYIRAALRGMDKIKNGEAYKAAEDKSAYLDELFERQSDAFKATVLERAEEAWKLDQAKAKKLDKVEVEVEL